MISPYSGACSRCGEYGEAYTLALIGTPKRRVCLDCLSNCEDINARLLKWRGHNMFPYQRTGAQWLQVMGKGLLADDQGLGKTVQALAAHPYAAPLVIVCPAVAKAVWREHLDHLRPDLESYLLSGRNSFRAPNPGEAAILNYAILAKSPELNEGTTVVLDEAHYCKAGEPGQESIRHLSARALCTEAERVYLLTGTPLKSRPPDLWGVLSTGGLEEAAFGDRATFERVFPSRQVKRGRSRFRYWGRPRSDAPELLRAVMLRRLKADVLPQLPAKRYDTHPVVLDVEAAGACSAFIEVLQHLGLNLQDMTAEILEAAAENPGTLPAREEFSRACAELARCKLAAVIDLIDDHEAHYPDEPLIVWSRHIDPLRVIAEREGWETIHGGVPHQKRDELAAKFQRGELKGLALGIAAAGTALTLTAASRAIFLDRSWSPADNAQAEDRIHRISQTNVCRYTDLVAEHALDQHLSNTLLDKKSIISASVDAAKTLA